MMIDDDLVITVDKDVSRAKPKRRRGVDMDHPRVKELLAMDMGDSFFLEGKLRKDARSRIEMGKKIGVFLEAREVDCDEIYQVKGTRVWRVTEDEMPKRKSSAKVPAAPVKSYWHNPETRAVYALQPGEQLDGDNPDWVEIEEAEYVRLSAEYDDL